MGFYIMTHRIHGAAIYGNMDPINISPMLAYIPYMDPMGDIIIIHMGIYISLYIIMALGSFTWVHCFMIYNQLVIGGI